MCPPASAPAAFSHALSASGFTIIYPRKRSGKRATAHTTLPSSPGTLAIRAARPAPNRSSSPAHAAASSGRVFRRPVPAQLGQRVLSAYPGGGRRHRHHAMREKMHVGVVDFQRAPRTLYHVRFPGPRLFFGTPRRRRVRAPISCQSGLHRHPRRVRRVAHAQLRHHRFAVAANRLYFQMEQRRDLFAGLPLGYQP